METRPLAQRLRRYLLPQVQAAKYDPRHRHGRDPRPQTPAGRRRPVGRAELQGFLYQIMKADLSTACIRLCDSSLPIQRSVVPSRFYGEECNSCLRERTGPNRH